MTDTASMERDQPININISRKKEPSEKYNKFKEYIIINNLELQSEVTSLKDRICEISIELQEKEIDEDKADTRIRYLRGLVNNLNELKKGYLEINKIKESLVKDTAVIWNNIFKIIEDYHKKLLIYNIIFGVINIIYILLSYTYFKCILNITINIVIIYTIVKTYIEYYNKIKKYKNNIKILKDTIGLKIKDTEKELFKLEESTLSLDNWIYEV